MTFDEFQKQAVRTGGERPWREGMIYSALSLGGEASEYGEHVKKMLFHGHAVAPEKLLEELGDALWSIAYAAHVNGATLEQVASGNVQKLLKRYPNGFSEAASRNREK